MKQSPHNYAAVQEWEAKRTMELSRIYSPYIRVTDACANLVCEIVDAIGKSNLIDSPGLFENNHQLVLSLVSGQAKSSEDLSKIVVKTTPLGAPVRIGDIAAVSPSGGNTLSSRVAQLYRRLRRLDGYFKSQRGASPCRAHQCTLARREVETQRMSPLR